MSTDPQIGRVIVLGSANVDAFTYVTDFPQPGETVLALDARTGLGGKGANQAVAASLTGANVSFAGAIGDDASGEFVRRTLATHGVDIAALATIPGVLTGSAAIAVDAGGENTIIVSSGANAVLDSAWVRGETVAGLFAGGAPAVGLAQGELRGEVVAEFAALCHETGTRFVLNLAPVIAVTGDVLRAADPLVVNEGEAFAVLGEAARDELSQDEAAALATRLAERSPSVVITLGASGAVYAGATGVDGVIAATHVPAPAPERVVDTTGAGDAFVGALAARLAAGDSLATAVHWGVAAGSAAVQGQGTVDSYAALRTLKVSLP